MIYQVKTYRINEEQLGVFNEFSHKYLLPNQKKQGAHLVGRWVDTSKEKITAIWKYDSYQEYEMIEQQIKQTKLHK
ncbi:NIPSNAP family protein [Bacillus sp. AK031]